MSKTLTMLISSGGGPAECRQAVTYSLRLLLKEAQQMGLTVDVAQQAAPHGPRSVIVQIHGEGARELANQWICTIQWVCKSSLRTGHKRQNWYLGIFELPTAKEAAPLEVSAIRFESFRAGEPGGQHQNTTDSAVRATCARTGMCVVVREGRSQHRNKAIAVERLQTLKHSRETLDQTVRGQQQNLLHHQLERGNPVRVFKGVAFKEVHR